MAGYYGAIRSSEGVAIITESGEQNTRETGHYKINERVSIIIVYGYKTAIRFCEERLKHLSHENDPVKITSEIKKQMEEHKNSNRAPFSAIITGFISPHLTFYFAVWMNGDKPIRLEPLPTASVFSDPHQQLGEYIIKKIFSPHSSMDEMVLQLAFSTRHCLNAAPISNELEIMTISNTASKKYSGGETAAVFAKVHILDNKLQKIFADLFLPDAEVLK